MSERSTRSVRCSAPRPGPNQRMPGGHRLHCSRPDVAAQASLVLSMAMVSWMACEQLIRHRELLQIFRVAHCENFCDVRSFWRCSGWFVLPMRPLSKLCSLSLACPPAIVLSSKLSESQFQHWVLACLSRVTLLTTLYSVLPNSVGFRYSIPNSLGFQVIRTKTMQMSAQSYDMLAKVSHYTAILRPRLASKSTLRRAISKALFSITKTTGMMPKTGAGSTPDWV